MALVKNWIREQCQTVGTGDIELNGAALGYVTFLAAFGATPNQVYYTVEDKITGYEEAGLGTFDGVNKITRDTPRAVFTGGVYDDTAPAPIYLSGNSEVACTFTSGAFNDLVQKTDADAKYLAITSASPVWTATAKATIQSDDIAILKADGSAYTATDANSPITGGTLFAAPRPFREVTESTTILLTDGNGVVSYSGQDATERECFLSSDEVFPQGSVITVIAHSFHAVRFTPISFMSIKVTPGKTPVSLVPSNASLTAAVCTLHRVSDTLWTISGDLEPE